MKLHCLIIATLFCVFALIVVGQNRRRPAPSPTPQAVDGPPGTENVKWQRGPSLANLGQTAQVHVPAGYVFAGGDDTRVIMEATQNPPSGRELGFVAPSGETWFAVFEFDPVGYVKDDEKYSLDADAMLESIKEGTEQGNRERAKRGWPAMTITGWEYPPRYNEATHNLEWAIRGESEGATTINYNTRLLGREGVMEVTLVTDAETLSETLPKFKTMLEGFEYKQGQKYGEFRAGDKTAAYGLTGLIVGGTTAVLVKTGAFKWLWKGIVALVLGAGALLRKLFSRRKAE